MSWIVWISAGGSPLGRGLLETNAATTSAAISRVTGWGMGKVLAEQPLLPPIMPKGLCPCFR